MLLQQLLLFCCDRADFQYVVFVLAATTSGALKARLLWRSYYAILGFTL